MTAPLDDCAPDVLELLVTHVDAPEKLLLAQEEFERLRCLLYEPIRQAILTMRVEGYSIEEICDQLQRSRRSVQLSIVEIRRVYERSNPPGK